MTKSARAGSRKHIAERSKRTAGRPTPEDAVGEQALVDAVRRLLRRRGPAEIMSREIAAEAGADPRLITYYFGSKAKLMETAAAATFDEFRSRTSEPADARPVAEQLRRRLRIFHEFARENPHMRELLADYLWSADDPEIARRGRQALADAAGEFAEIIDVGRETGDLWPMDARFLLAAVISLAHFPFGNRPMFAAIMGDEPDDRVVEQYTDFVVALILGGSRPPAAR